MVQTFTCLASVDLSVSTAVNYNPNLVVNIQLAIEV